MAGLIDLPGLRDRWQPAHGVIPTQDRDLTRSTPQWSITFPRDMNIADDSAKSGDLFIKQVQGFMATAPLGAKYSGPVDGQANADLFFSLQALQSALREKLEQPIIFNLGNTSDLNKSGIQRLFAKYQQYAASQRSEQDSINYIQQVKNKKAPAKPTKTESTDAMIKAFQIFLSQPQPLIGQVYHGPVDGQINNNLIDAAKQVESVIATYIDNDAVHGSLWNDSTQTFNTTPSDLKSALSIIVSHKTKNKSGLSHHQDIILSFSSILLKKY